MNVNKMEDDVRDCWSPKYGNDSRPWIIASIDDTSLDKNTMFTTTNQTVFIHQKVDRMPKKNIGKRRQLLEELLWQQVTEQLEEELLKDSGDQALSKSEYAERFATSEFMSGKDDEDKILQMKKKFPLYENVACSVWMDRKRNLAGRTSTLHNEPNRVFHRSSAFSKPLDEVLDIPRENSTGFK